MITIRQVVETELEQRPELVYLLQENLININGLARSLQSITEKQTGEKVGVDSIGMAIRRYQRRISGSSKVMHVPKAKNVQVQLDIAVLTFDKNVPTEILAKSSRYRFFSFAKSATESMLALSQEDIGSLSKQAIKYQPKMAALTITLQGESFQTVGAYAHIQTTLSLAGIPVAEVLSLHDDLTLIVEDQYIDRAFQVVRTILKSA